MRKLKLLLPLLLFFISSNVLAYTTKNGVEITDEDVNTSTSLSCSYGTNIIYFNDTSDHIEIIRYQNNQEIDGLMPFSSMPSKNDLKKYKFIRSDGSWDCPKHIILDGDKIIDTTNDDNDHRPNTGYIIQDLIIDESSCTGACTKQAISNNGEYTCNYESGSQKITVKGEGNKCTITYPDGSTKSETNGICGQVNSSCPDIFYNKKTKEMSWATYDYEDFFINASHYDSDMYDFLCKDDNDKNIMYFCKNGNCQFPKNKSINCGAVTNKINGSVSLCTDKNVKRSFKFFGYLLFAVKIIVPILLIILGIFQYIKVITSGASTGTTSAELMKKTNYNFIVKIIAGIVIFLLPSILNFIFGLIEPYQADSNNNASCTRCLFKPNNC